MDLLYRSCVASQKVLLNRFADWEVVGKEHVPERGPVILIANHVSNFDPSLLAVALAPIRIHFLAKEKLFTHPVSRWFMNTYGAYPIRETGVQVGAYRWAKHLLENDGALCVFPEGKRSTVGMVPGRQGATRLALATNAPLLPLGISGTTHLGSKLRVLKPTGKLRVTIGPAFNLSRQKSRPSYAEISALVDLTMGRIAELLPPSHRGYYD